MAREGRFSADFTIEELSMNAWPAPRTLFYDGWIVRLSGGYSKRANSVSPLYPSKIAPEEKIAYCERLFAASNLPVLYKLTDCEEHGSLDRMLAGLGYVIAGEASVETLDISAFPERSGGGITVESGFSERWKESVIRFNNIADKHADVFRAIIGNIAGEKIVVRKESGGETAGCGYGAIERGYVGVFDIVVNERFRGRGYGTEITGAILSEAARRGVRKSYLQVMLDNSAALRLYGKLGYRESYRYLFRKQSG